MTSGKQDPDGTLHVRTDEVRRVIVDKASSSLTYEGRALSSSTGTDQPRWQIKRILAQGNIVDTQFAGDGKFNQIWDDRTSIFPLPAFLNTKSLKLDGVDEYIKIGTQADIQFERTDAFTLSIWVKKIRDDQLELLLSNASPSPELTGIHFFIHSNNKPRLQFISDFSVGNVIDVSGSNSVLSMEGWVNLLCAYDGSGTASGVKIFKNGTEQPLSIASSSVTGSTQSTQEWLIGRHASKADKYLGGNVDEVAFWDQALNPSQAAEVYNSGSPRDLIATGLHPNPIHWYRMGDKATFPTFPDQIQSLDAVAVNMQSTDIKSDVP